MTKTTVHSSSSSSTPHSASSTTPMNSVKTPPANHVYQLILEQFWGDGVSKREIRCVYTTAEDANWACREYLLRTWPKDHFTMYDEVPGPQGDASLVKIAAEIQGGDRFNCWVEKQPFKGQLDFSSKAIAKRAGKGPTAYILQRTIKDARGGKRRSTTRGIFATRLLAKEALAADQPPAEWSSNQGYVLEPGGEYASAMSPSGKTAWLFIEVRPLYMSYTRLDQELQVAQQSSSHKQPLSSSTPSATTTTTTITTTTEGSAANPISLDGAEGADDAMPTTPTTTIIHTATTVAPTAIIPQDPFSPLIANPDEAGAYVYLVLQLKTIPFAPPILTVEAVTYELQVANDYGEGLLDLFSESLNISFTPEWRDDGCLQVTIDHPHADDGLTVWVEKRAVVLGHDFVAGATLDQPSLLPPMAAGASSASPSGFLATAYALGGGGPGMDYQLISERASIQYEMPADDHKAPPVTTTTTTTTTSTKRREDSNELADGHPEGSRPAKAAKLSCPSTTSPTSGEQAKGAVEGRRRFQVVRQRVGEEQVVLGSFDELKRAKTFARVKCYASLSDGQRDSGGDDGNDGMQDAEVEEADEDHQGQGEGACACFRIRAIGRDGSVFDDVRVQDTAPGQGKQ